MVFERIADNLTNEQIQTLSRGRWFQDVENGRFWKMDFLISLHLCEFLAP